MQRSEREHIIRASGDVAILGLFFLTRARRALLPLIIGHGLVDTVSLTINFFS